MDVVLVVLLILVLLGGGTGPWFHWHSYGYAPTGILWTLALVCLIVWLVRRTRTL